MSEFVASDLHLGHYNIIKYCNRPFLNTVDMDRTLINNWNKVISPDDIIHFLGDFCWGNKPTIKDYSEQLNGIIYFRKGNHDRESNDVYAEFFNTVRNNNYIYTYKDVRILFSHFPVISESMSINVDNKYNSFKIISDMSYNNFDINAHGHIHNNEALDDGKHFNASIEVIGYNPVSLDKIIEVIK